MNTFIIAMIVVVLNGAPQYWYNINEVNPHTSTFACQSEIEDAQYQQRALQGFNSIFRNKVAMIRLACLTEDKVEAYKVYMTEQNQANVARMSNEQG